MPSGGMQHPADLGQDDRQIGPRLRARRHDDADAVRFHERARLAAAEVGIDEVEIGDLDAPARARELQRQVDGDFGLAGAVVADDRDHAIAGSNDGGVCGLLHPRLDQSGLGGAARFRRCRAGAPGRTYSHSPSVPRQGTPSPCASQQRPEPVHSGTGRRRFRIDRGDPVASGSRPWSWFDLTTAPSHEDMRRILRLVSDARFTSEWSIARVVFGGGRRRSRLPIGSSTRCPSRRSSS